LSACAARLSNRFYKMSDRSEGSPGDDHPFFENVFIFVHLLRQAGLPVSLSQTLDAIHGLTLVDIGARDQVYHTMRCLLVTHVEHLRLFETLFNRFWRGETTPVRQRPPRRRRPMPRTGLVPIMAVPPQPDMLQTEAVDQTKIYSDLEALKSKAFARMTPEELDAIQRLMQSMQWKISLRQTRRRVPSRAGDMLHYRRVMRSTVRYGGVPIALAWQRRKIKQRPLILIADISGSMEKHSRLLLQFFHSVSHSLPEVESFVFGTRLSRITPQLKLKNIDIALEEAAHEVVDWSGGTRIGACLRAFNHDWSRRVLRRGALVMIVSDGWDRGDVEVLRQEMRYLQHRCHHLIWLNPLLGSETYKPLVEGMAAALPYVDSFLPCHNLHSLEDIARHLATLDDTRPRAHVHHLYSPHLHGEAV
jgi:uncharacterized protein with von Willebrand factor type A (vWA) domain